LKSTGSDHAAKLSFFLSILSFLRLIFSSRVSDKVVFSCAMLVVLADDFMPVAKGDLMLKARMLNPNVECRKKFAMLCDEQ
jgi:hypothetical protein